MPLSAHKLHSTQPTVFHFDLRRLGQLNYIEVEMDKVSDSSGPHTPKNAHHAPAAHPHAPDGAVRHHRHRAHRRHVQPAESTAAGRRHIQEKHDTTVPTCPCDPSSQNAPRSHFTAEYKHRNHSIPN